MSDDVFSERDRADLRRAVRLLDENSLVVRATSILGRAVEHAVIPGSRFMPEPLADAVREALERALSLSFDLASGSVRRRTGLPLLDRALGSRWINMATVIASGAGGGLAGLPGVVAELPFTTMVLMRAIAQTAAEEGEDLRSETAKLECLQVFALGSPGAESEADYGYYAVRLGFAQALGGLAGRSVSQVLPRAVALTAARFGVPVAWKVAAESLPIMGAATGAMLNGVFIDHFQGKARGHFIIRRLERRHGAEEVRRAYDSLRA